ncbi:hypothetical protein [uncultured Brevundimonas sp.]|uniref:hypothetical protein n=1 Tax=uncultured Brevundimonas sp. TaxID=213418 RepID=UPI0025EAF058|nr:hypothetical protein [uncultured Brevundimonas sp.]
MPDDPEMVERWLAAVEAALRRQGFGERTIKNRRAANRATIIAHLRSQSGRD